MVIKFKVIFSNGNIQLVEYRFNSFSDCVFDMLHYNEQGDRIDSKTVLHIQVKKAIRNLIERGRKNGATITINERDYKKGMETIILI